jgi:hypothetical protein
VREAQLLCKILGHELPVWRYNHDRGSLRQAEISPAEIDASMRRMPARLAAIHRVALTKLEDLVRNVAGRDAVPLGQVAVGNLEGVRDMRGVIGQAFGNPLQKPVAAPVVTTPSRSEQVLNDFE